MLEPYEEYIPVESKWIDAIPSTWDYKRVKELFIERKERNNPIKTHEILALTAKQGVIPYSQKRSGGGNKAKEDHTQYNIAHPNDLLINCMNVVAGSAGVSKYYGAISPVYYALSQRDDNINIWYYHRIFRLMPFQRSLLGLGKGILMRESSSGALNTIRMRIPMSNLNNVMLPVPPREEQDQIVRFLDWKLSKINKLILAKKKQTALLYEQKQVIVNNAVTKGFDPSVPMKDSGIEWIGTIPEHWKVLYLSQTATEQSISNKDIHNQNLLSLSYGKIINKDINTTDGLLPASFDTYQIVHNGNIILRLTDLQNDHKSLRVGLVTQTGIITSAYTCLLPRKNVIPEFLYLLLHSYDVCKVFYGMGGGVRQSIGFNEIRRLLIPVPPLAEQKQIVDYCYTKIDFIERLIVSIEKEILLLTEYRTRLISDVVTGKVDVRGIEIPEYEAVPDDVTEDELDDENALDDETGEEEVE